MKINISENENKILIKLEDGSTLEEYEKDKPINFKKILNFLVDLKLESRIIFNQFQSDDIKNQAFLNIVFDILNKYNENVDEYLNFIKTQKEKKI